MIPPFEKFIKNPFSGRLITFDPGQTTGYSIWDSAKLTDCGQLATFPLKDCVHMLDGWFDRFALRREHGDNLHVRIEEYRVYQHMTESHAHNDMHTSRLIGALEAMLTLRGISYDMCGAGLAKAFTNADKPTDKVDLWGFWQKGQKHARDAIRHGIYFYCTPPKGE